MGGLFSALGEMMDTAVLAGIVAGAAPLLLATLGETISEKAGVINLSLDGSMMLAALAGFVVAFQTDVVWLGFPAAAAVGAGVALVVGFSSIKLKLNQVAVGFVLFALCTELSVFLGNSYVGRRPIAVPSWDIPVLSSIPPCSRASDVANAPETCVGDILFGHNLIVYLSLIAVVAAYFFIYRTRAGLELQGIGERPEAAHSRGIPVNKLRYMYTILGGVFVGFAGAAYSLDVRVGWADRPTRNLGWIALAIVIFGGWHPFRVAFGVFLFGFLQALALQLQPEFPSLTQVLPIIPFPAMILALVVVNWKSLVKWLDKYPALRAILRSDPPAAIGTHFEVD